MFTGRCTFSRYWTNSGNRTSEFVRRVFREALVRYRVRMVLLKTG